MATTALRSASALALIFGAFGGSAAAQQAAQQPAPGPQTVTTSAQETEQKAPAAVEQTAPAKPEQSSERVVVTGSLIATAREDSPKPVEVYSAQDLTEQGTPSVTEFIRS